MSRVVVIGGGPAGMMAAYSAAMSGKEQPAKARLAFEAFAKSRGILAPEALIETAGRAADEWLAG